MLSSSGCIFAAVSGREQVVKLYDLNSMPEEEAEEAEVEVHIDELLAVGEVAVDCSAGIRSLCVHGDGAEVRLAVACENQVRLWRQLPPLRQTSEPESWGEPLQLVRCGSEAQGMQFSKDGKQLLVCTRRHLLLCTVPFSSASTQPVILELAGTSSLTFACFLEPENMNDEDGGHASRVFVVDSSGVLRIWDVLEGNVVNELVLDLSRGLAEGEQPRKASQHPENRNKLAVASNGGQLWVCGFRGDLFAVIASTSIAREAAQALHMELDAEAVNVLDVAWLSNGDGGALAVVTAVGTIALHTTQLSLRNFVEAARRASARITCAQIVSNGNEDVCIAQCYSDGDMVVSRVFDRNEETRPAVARASALDDATQQEPRRTDFRAAPEAAATPVESLFLRPAQTLPTGSLMALVMQHRRKKAPTAEQKQQLRQLSWDTFDQKAVAQPTNGAGAKVVDMPVTFHNRIKSSGYGQSKPSAKKSQAFFTTAVAAAKKMRAMCAPTYAIGELPGHHQSTNDLREPAPLRFIKFSGDGSMFALGYAGGDHSVRCVKHPVRRYGGDGFSLVGHQARVNCVDFSCDNKLALSVSDDKSARLWKLHSGGELCAVIRHQKRSPRLEDADAIALGSKASNGVSTNPLFNAELLSGKFYGMDRLICCASGATLFVYSYELNAAAHKDISKHRNRFQLNYKLAHAWTAAGQQITSLACWNNTNSPYLLVGSTNRSVQIFDAAAMQTAHVYEDCHSKAISHVALSTPSQTANVPQDKYTFFATCATDSTVRLWDVRFSNALATLSEHTNHREAIACDISPCLTYLAVGSEDGRSYIYDIRTLRSVAVLPGHRDVVSCCAFNPVHLQLATASYDSCVRFYAADRVARVAEGKS